MRKYELRRRIERLTIAVNRVKQEADAGNQEEAMRVVQVARIGRSIRSLFMQIVGWVPDGRAEQQ